MAQQFEDPDLPQGRYGEALFFRMQQNLFQSDMSLGGDLLGPKNLSKSTLADLPERLVRLGHVTTPVVRGRLVRYRHVVLFCGGWSESCASVDVDVVGVHAGTLAVETLYEVVMKNEVADRSEI